MKTVYLNKSINILAIIAIIVFGANAFAQQLGQSTYDTNENQKPVEKKFYRNYCYMNKLTKEQIQKIHEQRKAFFNETEDLRQQLYEKETDLKSVLAKKEPDVEKAKAIQKEISDLKSQLEQKKIDHYIKIKKINPYLGRKAWKSRYRNKEGFGSHFCGGCW